MVKDDRLFPVLEEFFGRCMNMANVNGMDRLVELDLSFTQARSLFILAHAGEAMPIHALAEQLRLSVAATGRNVDQLVTMGLVERREDTSDRRVKLVSMTDAGHDTADHHIEAKRQALRTMITRLTPEESDRLFEALQPIVAGDALRPTSQENPA